MWGLARIFFLLSLALFLCDLQTARADLDDLESVPAEPPKKEKARPSDGPDLNSSRETAPRFRIDAI